MSRRGEILSKTNDFIELYMYAAGQSVAPSQYHFWCAISILAATLKNKVGVHKPAFRGLIYPNLMVFLLGPSGVGKGVAIQEACSLLRPSHARAFDGSFTSASIADWMGRAVDPEQLDDDPDADDPDQREKWERKSKMFLVTPELGESVGNRDMAWRLITRITEWYGATHRIIYEHTRTSGFRQIWHPCINWLAASTYKWLRKSVDKSAIEGGFFARCVAVPARYKREFKQPDPKRPGDSAYIRKYLRARLDAIAELEGTFTLSDEATEVREQWHSTIPEPYDPLVVPFWQRRDDFVLKLALILTIARAEQLTERVIPASSIVDAQKLFTNTQIKLPEVYANCANDIDTSAFWHVRTAIQEAGVIGHSQLLRKLSHANVRASDLEGSINTLRQTGLVRVVRGRGKTYKWCEKGRDFDISATPDVTPEQAEWIDRHLGRDVLDLRADEIPLEGNFETASVGLGEDEE